VHEAKKIFAAEKRPTGYGTPPTGDSPLPVGGAELNDQYSEQHQGRRRTPKAPTDGVIEERRSEHHAEQRGQRDRSMSREVR